MREICTSGELGTIGSIGVAMCFPLPRFSDIRYSYPLGGGAMMDAGSYTINCMRLLGNGLPEVVTARATRHSAHIDRAMTAQLRFPDGAEGRITASMWSRRLLAISARVVGDQGELRVLNYLAPHIYHRLTIKTPSGTRHEKVRGEPTYTYQLRAFTDAVLHGGPVLTSADDAVITMGLIDDVYRAADMPIRGER
jgi:predicted dehydrogenase